MRFGTGLACFPTGGIAAVADRLRYLVGDSSTYPRWSLVFAGIVVVAAGNVLAESAIRAVPGAIACCAFLFLVDVSEIAAAGSAARTVDIAFVTSRAAFAS